MQAVMIVERYYVLVCVDTSCVQSLMPGVEAEHSSIRLGAVKHGRIPDKDRLCPYSTILRRTRRRTAVKSSFFTVLDGARPSLWRHRRARPLMAV